MAKSANIPREPEYPFDAKRNSDVQTDESQKQRHVTA